jgi:hypothetical protein
LSFNEFSCSTLTVSKDITTVLTSLVGKEGRGRGPGSGAAGPNVDTNPCALELLRKLPAVVKGGAPGVLSRKLLGGASVALGLSSMVEVLSSMMEELSITVARTVGVGVESCR